MRSVINYFGVQLGSEITVPVTGRAAVLPIKASSLQMKVYTDNAASYLKFPAFYFLRICVVLSERRGHVSGHICYLQHNIHWFSASSHQNASLDIKQKVSVSRG